MKSNTRHRVLAHLEAHKGTFVSGESIASELGISRNSVWKAVRALENEGWPIESVTGKGYRLQATSSRLSAASIERYLQGTDACVEFHEQIGSTNTRCKELAESGAPAGTLIVADCQTNGRGRQGRAFYSPAGSGVYFSLLLRPMFSLSSVTLLTSYAAIACAQAIEEVCNVDVQVKWVNDLFCHGHKVCGILTEASFDAETQSVAYTVVGIGVNVFDPPEDFAPDEAYAVHSVCGKAVDTDDIRARIVAGTVRRILDKLEQVPQKPHLAEYRRRSLLDGRTVHIEDRKLGSTQAKVLGINDDFTLSVELPDGSTRALVGGEVHIPSSQL